MGNFSYLNPGKPSIFKDQYVTKVSECIVPFANEQSGDFGLVGLPFSKSSISFSQAAEAPKIIRSCLGNFSTYSGEQNKDYKDLKIIDFGDVLTHPTNIEASIDRMYISVREMLDKGVCSRYILLGGDHGVSYPSIRAFQEKFGTVGIIQWDAHHDVRNLEDGGRTNGTPFRSLLEGGFIQGEHLVQIGIRDFANAKKYHDYIKAKGITAYSMANVESEGIVQIVRREIERLASLVDVIYLSVDMDAVDQAFAPGCPAIGPGGLTSRELLTSISEASSHEKVIAMDIVEIDPSKDFRDITSRLAANAIIRFMYTGKY